MSALRRHPVVTGYVGWHVFVIVLAISFGRLDWFLAGVIPSLSAPAMVIGFYAIVEGPRFVWEALWDGGSDG